MTVFFPKIRFVPGDITDLEEIIKIERVSFAFPWTEGMILSELYDNPFSFCSVLRTDAKREMVGYVFMRELRDELHLLSVAVHPKWRRRGLGKQLVQHVLSTCQGKSLERVFLEVRASNRSAQSLYRKFDFFQVGVHRHYYCNPTEDAILFQWNTPAHFLQLKAFGAESFDQKKSPDRGHLKHVHSNLV